MKEFETNLSSVLMVGLAPEESYSGHEVALKTCVNCRPSKRGIIPIVELENPFDAFVPFQASWPFPQAFSSSLTNYMVTGTRIYEILPDMSPLSKFIWNATAQVTYADFLKFLVLSDGLTTVKRNESGIFSLTSMPGANSVLNVRGQLMLGGVLGYREEVWWSKIGSADFTIDRSNTAGRMNLGIGEVYKLLLLGKSIMAYGEKGIAQLTFHQDPAPTYGLRHVAGFGILSRGAVCGNDQVHYFLDVDGSLWKVTQEGLTYLGYRYLFKEMDEEKLVSFFDLLEEEAYFSDGATCYVYGNGLWQSTQCPSSLLRLGAKAYGTKASSVQYAQIATAPFNLRQSGMKTVVTVEADVRTSCYARIYGRNSAQEALVHTSSVLLSPSGVATTKMTAVEHSIEITTAEPSEFFLTDLRLRVNLTDFRTIRGLYGGKASS